jgi:peptidoglycan/LPS O-acetylase OafA/YrhL
VILKGTWKFIQPFGTRAHSAIAAELPTPLTASAENFLQMSHTRRIPSLDGLRGIAAIAVMAFHFNIFFLPQARLPFVGRGYLAVDLFFLLSGFVMAHVYGLKLASNWRAHWEEFAIARFARIYPLFALTLLAVMIVHLSDPRLSPVSFSVRSLALQPILLQQWSGLSWNYPSWSISTEVEAYFFFVFSADVLVSGKYPRFIGACCVAILAAMCIAKGGTLNFYRGIPALLRTLTEFSLGALLYRAHSNDAGVSRKWVAPLTLLFLGQRDGCVRQAAELSPFSCSRQLVIFGLSLASARALRYHGCVCCEWLSR